jgi:hypothetical protein
MVKYDGLGVLRASILIINLNGVLGGDCAHRSGFSYSIMEAGRLGQFPF